MSQTFWFVTHVVKEGNTEVQFGAVEMEDVMFLTTQVLGVLRNSVCPRVN